MKPIYRNIAIAATAMLALTSCNDFLEKEPLSDGTEVIVFKNPEQFKAAANAFYAHLPGWNYIGS